MHNKHYKKTFGFSLIELMVAVAIIGILTAVATPVYVSYTIKANVTNALPILDSLKAKVSDYYAANNAFPASLTDIFPGGSSITSNSFSDGKTIASANIGTATTYGSITGAIGYVQVTFSGTAPTPTQLQNKVLALVAIDSPTATT